MRWEKVRNAIFGERTNAYSDEVQSIEPRALTEREHSWITDILLADPQWSNADISQTQVVAQGPCTGGFSIVLQGPHPENPSTPMSRELVGQLWITLGDQSLINVQLSTWQGRLTELYFSLIDPKHPEKKLPAVWTEVSRVATAG